MDIVVLVISFAVILAGAELFTNGIEWFGHKLELGEGAIGSVLAAVGTALPETMIPFIAIVFGGGIAGSEVGVGAILGAPFMLSTLAMFVTGAAILLMRRRRATGETLTVDTGRARPRHGLLRGRLRDRHRRGVPPGRFEWPRRLIAVALLVHLRLLRLGPSPGRGRRARGSRAAALPQARSPGAPASGAAPASSS